MQIRNMEGVTAQTDIAMAAARLENLKGKEAQVGRTCLRLNEKERNERRMRALLITDEGAMQVQLSDLMRTKEASEKKAKLVETELLRAEREWRKKYTTDNIVREETLNKCMMSVRRSLEGEDLTKDQVEVIMSSVVKNYQDIPSQTEDEYVDEMMGHQKMIQTAVIEDALTTAGRYAALIEEKEGEIDELRTRIDSRQNDIIETATESREAELEAMHLRKIVNLAEKDVLNAKWRAQQGFFCRRANPHLHRLKKKLHPSNENGKRRCKTCKRVFGSWEVYKCHFADWYE